MAFGFREENSFMNGINRVSNGEIVHRDLDLFESESRKQMVEMDDHEPFEEIIKARAQCLNFGGGSKNGKVAWFVTDKGKHPKKRGYQDTHLPRLLKEFGREKLRLCYVPNKGSGKRLRAPKDILSELLEHGFEYVHEDGTIEDYFAGEFEGVAWTPKQLVAINHAANRAFDAIERAFKKQEEKKEAKEHRLAERNISHLQNAAPLISKEKLFNLREQNLKDEMKKRFIQEQIETERANQAKRTKEKRRKEREKEHEIREDRYLKREKRKWDQKQENIKLENGIKTKSGAFWK